MTKEEILNLTDKDFRDWMCRLSKEKRLTEIALISKIRLGGLSDSKRDSIKMVR